MTGRTRPLEAIGMLPHKRERRRRHRGLARIRHAGGMALEQRKDRLAMHADGAGVAQRVSNHFGSARTPEAAAIWVKTSGTVAATRNSSRLPGLKNRSSSIRRNSSNSGS